MSQSAGHALTLRTISHSFGQMVAANAIDLDIRPGELVSLLGPSGCGKTTLLKIIAGFLRQTSGDVLVDGASITRLPTNRRRIGIVFQNYALFPHMSVAQNIAYGPAAAGRPKAEIAAVVAEMLDVVQMGALRDRLPRELSGGQQQRVALARCLAIRPKILLLDEPFSALDKNLRLDMQIEIKRLQRHSGITTVMVTHDQEEALGMSDRIAVLSRGNLEQFAPPSDIYDRPASLFVNTFVGTANFLKGEVVGSSPAGAAVRLEGGAVIETGRETALVPGARVLVAVRPEGLRVRAEGGPGALGAQVTAVMPIGPSFIYEVRLADGTAVKVVQERDEAAPLSGAVFLHLKPNRISGLFPDLPGDTHKKGN
ncbi:ABC transporter ATP-binding protein [Xanthobacter oligotrophicus]|uniref:ABC transporter ATP-binding protein n=1 Tax=Xanthobacter oligotrophicus TaxID=2607286 RepID=UPI0011F0A44F|nr:ABC transporter ATP-binding protein [Xanthobacter oligotrophicus]MCG5237920.1 ABC transporter ATP-binding protein [Xanthobacter oligotrophicus]